MTAWKFENTKDNAIAFPSEGAMSRYERMGYETADFYEHFPCFTGAKYLARFISLQQCYMQTLGIAGHIAEVGVYRGACSFFFAKLAVLYEPNSMTQVHGFDLFERVEYPPDADKGYSFKETYQRVLDLVEVQGFQGHLKLHQLDARTDFPAFFEENSHLQFKLVLIDSGAEYSIVKSSIEAFWPRLAYGGIMIFDQYNHEVAPEETRAVNDCLPPGTVIRTFPNGWMPTAYVIKELPKPPSQAEDANQLPEPLPQEPSRGTSTTEEEDTPEIRLARQERRPPDWDYDARPLGHPANRPQADIVADYLKQTPRGRRGINLGCGGFTFKGWLNIDFDQPWHLDIQCDLSKGAPFLPEGQFDAIFSEHFFEHIGRKEARHLLDDCFRSLRPGGRIRIAIPSLESAFELHRVRIDRPHLDKDIEDHFGEVMGTPAEAFNLAIRAWGHQYMYDKEEICSLLQRVGFVNIRKVKIRESDFALLHNREARSEEESSLIVEAGKPSKLRRFFNI